MSSVAKSSEVENVVHRVVNVDKNLVSEVLSQLIETCLDAQHGFAVAARGVDDPLLKAELLQYSFQRQRFANQLTEAAWDIGVRDLEQQKHLARPSKWVDIKQAILRSDKSGILEECQRSEDISLRVYHEVRYGVLPVNVASLVHSQANAIQRVLDRIRYLRDTFASPN